MVLSEDGRHWGATSLSYSNLSEITNKRIFLPKVNVFTDLKIVITQTGLKQTHILLKTKQFATHDGQYYTDHAFHREEVKTILCCH